MESSISQRQFDSLNPAGSRDLFDWSPGTFALRDAWFGVAHIADVTAPMIRRAVHSQPVFLWRDGKRIRATDCHPERFARSDNPASDSVSGGEYPLTLRYGMVWVWYGDPANADPVLIPDVPFIGHDEIVPRYMRGTEYFNCTYELVMENVLDLTHIDFVHRNFAAGEEAESDTIRYLSSSETVTVIRDVKRKRTPQYQRDMGIDSEYQDMTVYTHVHLRSGTTFFHARYDQGLAMPILQTNVPEARNRTRLSFAFGGHDCPSEEYRRSWPRTSPLVAAQDERVLRPQHQRYLPLQSARRPDLCTRFDAAGLELRRRMQQLITRQQQQDYRYLPDYPGQDIAETFGMRRIAGKRGKQA